MGKRPPGLSQEDMIALWKTFVKATFGATKFKTTFNSSTRNVYRDGTKRLVVLDEKHGHLEVLAFQKTPGAARHLGIQELETEVQPAKENSAAGFVVTLGASSSGGNHKFELQGSL